MDYVPQFSRLSGYSSSFYTYITEHEGHGQLLTCMGLYNNSYDDLKAKYSAMALLGMSYNHASLRTLTLNQQ